jgi:hypothetical protein
MYLSLSLPRVEGADLRPWVPPEHSLVISSTQHPTKGHEAHTHQPEKTALDWDAPSFLTLEYEAAAQMAKQKLRVSSVRCCKPSHLVFVSEGITRSKNSQQDWHCKVLKSCDTAPIAGEAPEAHGVCGDELPPGSHEVLSARFLLHWD